ncbi:MAG: transposase, partial [Cyanobacteria bacterium QH_9_48_43]
MATAKKTNPELKIPSNHVLQQTLKRLEQAFTSMWERGYGFPRFKKSGQLRSIVFPQLNKEVVKNNRVNLPKLGWIKARFSRSIPDGFVIKQARIVKKARGYFVVLCIQSDVEVPE